MGSRTIPHYKGPDPEGLEHAEMVKSRITDKSRWNQLKDYLVSGLTSPIRKADQIGQHMKDVYAGEAAPNPVLAAEAALLAQGAGHATGAGGTGVASIGKNLAIKKIAQEGAKHKAKPSTIAALKDQIRFTPQEILDDVTDIQLRDLSPLATQGGTLRGGYSTKTKRIYLDPKNVSGTTLPHEMTHSAHTVGGGLTPKNQFYSDIFNSIKTRVEKKGSEGKRSKAYYDMYRKKQIPTEVLANKHADQLNAELYKRKGMAGLNSQITINEYNKLYEESAEKIIEGLKKTAPKTYQKARSETLKKYIASRKET